MRYLRRKHQSLPELRGFEEEEGGSEGGTDEGGSEGGSSESEEEDEDEDEDDGEEEEEDDGDDGDDKDPSALKSALQKERDERKRLARENKELNRYKKRTEKEKLTKEEQLQSERDEAVQERDQAVEAYNNIRLDFAISEAARKANFRDTDDALRGVDRESLIDEDGELDTKAVQKAVKALAEQKPHYVATEGEKPPPSGSRFGGKKKHDEGASEDTLKSKYPALSR